MSLRYLIAIYLTVVLWGCGLRLSSNESNIFEKQINDFSLEEYNCELGPFKSDTNLHIIDSSYSTIELDSADKSRLLTSLFLEIYISHLTCFDQSYNLYQEPMPKILKDYIEITNIDFEKLSFIQQVPSSISYEYAISNPALVKHELIRSKIKRIEQIRSTSKY